MNQVEQNCPFQFGKCNISVVYQWCLYCSSVFEVPYGSCVCVVPYCSCVFVVPYWSGVFMVPYCSGIFAVPYCSCVFVVPYCVFVYLCHIVVVYLCIFAILKLCICVFVPYFSGAGVMAAHSSPSTHQGPARSEDCQNLSARGWHKCVLILCKKLGFEGEVCFLNC